MKTYIFLFSIVLLGMPQLSPARTKFGYFAPKKPHYRALTWAYGRVRRSLRENRPHQRMIKYHRIIGYTDAAESISTALKSHLPNIHTTIWDVLRANQEKFSDQRQIPDTSYNINEIYVWQECLDEENLKLLLQLRKILPCAASYYAGCVKAFDLALPALETAQSSSTISDEKSSLVQAIIKLHTQREFCQKMVLNPSFRLNKQGTLFYLNAEDLSAHIDELSAE